MTETSIHLRKIFIRNHTDWKFWIGVALLFKVSLFLLQISQGRPNEIAGFIGNTSGDTESYLKPIEGLLSTGNYTPDYRMPGYGTIYLLLRLVCPVAIACNAVIILQVLIASISVYLLALTARNCFNSERLFYLSFYSFAISSYANLFDSYLLSDSFCTSTTIIYVFFFSLYLNYRDKKFLLYGGASLTWVIFLRPMYAPLLIISLIILGYSELAIQSRLKTIARLLIIFLIPFFLVESAWITRNYLVHRKVIILTKTLYSEQFQASYLMELMNFVKAWGGDRTWWNPNSEMRWFGVAQDGLRKPENVSIPDYIYTSRFNIDSLKIIKSSIEIINSDTTKESTKDALTFLIKRRLTAYTESIKLEKPFLFYVKAPILLTKRFFVHSGTYNLFNKVFSELNPLELLLKIFYSAYYLISLIFGYLGLMVVGYKYPRNPKGHLIIALLLYSTILFPLILKQIEFRYFLPAYPFLLLLACCFTLFLIDHLKKLFKRTTTQA